MAKAGPWTKSLLACATCWVTLVCAAAQQPPPPQGLPPGPSSGPPSGPPPSSPPPFGPPSRNSADASTVSTMRGGLQLGPPGRWWDDREFSRSLALRPEQQSRMDAIFEENRANLLRRYQAYQGEQSNLEALTRAKVLDESALMAAIDRVGRTRIALEQANTHMLLQIRSQMTPEQIMRLEAHR